MIGVTTLLPSGGPQPAGGLCLICGERGMADALLNLLVFAPLGFLLVRRFGWRWGFVAPVLVSCGIELAQQVIPGRNPSIGDIVFNGLGGAIGAAVGCFGPWLGRGRLAHVGFGGVIVLAAAALGLTAWLSEPAPPDAAYYGQWTPELGHYDHYRGRVIDARVGEVRVPGERLEAWERLRAAFAAGADVEVSAIAGPPPAGLAPVFSIYDERQREAFLLGLDGDDVVVQYRTRAADFRFDHYRHRAAGLARGIDPGDPMRFAVRTGPDGVDIRLNGRHRHLEEPRLARGWELLVGATPPATGPVVDLLWLAVLFAPAGFFAPGRGTLLLGWGLLTALLVALPAFSWLAPVHAGAVPSASLALLGGAAARLLYGRLSAGRRTAGR